MASSASTPDPLAHYVLAVFLLWRCPVMEAGQKGRGDSYSSRPCVVAMVVTRDLSTVIAKTAQFMMCSSFAEEPRENEV